MPLKAADWHKRFTQQAGWTASSRQYLFNLAGITVDSLLLDLGCGTGAIAADLAATASRQPVGIDTSTEFLALAANHVPDGRFVNGDGHELPFMQAAFDACYCHYVLMWVKEPLLVLQEMARVYFTGQDSWISRRGSSARSGLLHRPRKTLIPNGKLFNTIWKHWEMKNPSYRPTRRKCR
jgi:SAM-dependent methyltransferase